MARVWMDGLDGLDRLAADIGASPQRVGARSEVVLRKSVLAGEALSKQICAVDTGFLRGSIGHEFRGDLAQGSMEGMWGPTASYGPYLEYGTERMAPQAFVGPSFDRVVPDYIAGLAAVNNPLD